MVTQQFYLYVFWLFELPVAIEYNTTTTTNYYDYYYFYYPWNLLEVNLGFWGYPVTRTYKSTRVHVKHGCGVDPGHKG